MRILTRADPRTHIVDLHQMTQLTSLQDRRTDHVNLIMFKVTLGEVPDSIKQMFNYISEVRERITRSVTRGDLFVPPKRIDTSARCLSKRGPDSYNDLSADMRMCKSLDAFKRAQKANHGFNPG